MADERVTLTAGVPTVWMAVLQALDEEPDRWDLSALQRLLVGGSAVPRSLLEGFDRHGLTIIQAWGMTETSPLGSVARLPPDLLDAPLDEQYDYRARQGVPVPFVEIRARGEDGEMIPWDDRAMGELEVRGPWVAAAYHRARARRSSPTTDGSQPATWSRSTRTGASGSATAPRTSSSQAVSGSPRSISRTLLMAHPAVEEAAVIAIPDERWGERPLAVVVLREGEEAGPDALREHLAGEFAKWQLPDRFEYIDALPRTATGKFKKTDLRERFVETAV